MGQQRAQLAEVELQIGVAEEDELAGGFPQPRTKGCSVAGVGRVTHQVDPLVARAPLVDDRSAPISGAVVDHHDAHAASGPIDLIAYAFDAPPAGPLGIASRNDHRRDRPLLRRHCGLVASRVPPRGSKRYFAKVKNDLMVRLAS